MISEDSYPQQLGRYRVERVLGKGNFGLVLQCTVQGALGFQRRYAVKVLHAQALLDVQEAVRSLADEATALSLLNHQGIVQVFEFDQVDVPPFGKLAYLAMDFVAGPNLNVLNRHNGGPGRMPVESCLALTLDLLEALDFVHGARRDDGTPLGLLHRDVKPGNVAVTPEGAGVLLDFGVARFEGRLQAATNAGMVKGTLLYMAPELILGEAHSPASDLYAAGAMAWELLVGRPFVRVVDARRFTPAAAEQQMEYVLNNDPEGRASQLRDDLVGRHRVPKHDAQRLAGFVLRLVDERPRRATRASELDGDLDWIANRWNLRAGRRWLQVKVGTWLATQRQQKQDETWPFLPIVDDHGETGSMTDLLLETDELERR